jgi:PIN domain nuclease of toxin-antitoxin system
MNYLLDACALLAFFNKERGWENVRDLLEKAETGEINIFMNAIKNPRCLQRGFFVP